MEKEVWKQIEGYEGEYEVSNYGRIKSLKNNRCGIMKSRRHTHGYLRIALTKNGKQKDYYIHRLVVQHFLQKMEGKKEVNHKDGRKDRNLASNLEWADRSDNERHKIYILKHGNAKAVECVETGEVFDSVSLAAKSVGGYSGNLSAHLKGKEGHGSFAGLHWRYKE